MSALILKHISLFLLLINYLLGYIESRCTLFSHIRTLELTPEMKQANLFRKQKNNEENYENNEIIDNTYSILIMLSFRNEEKYLKYNKLNNITLFEEKVKIEEDKEEMLEENKSYSSNNMNYNVETQDEVSFLTSINTHNITISSDFKEKDFLNCSVDMLSFKVIVSEIHSSEKYGLTNINSTEKVFVHKIKRSYHSNLAYEEILIKGLTMNKNINYSFDIVEINNENIKDVNIKDNSSETIRITNDYTYPLYKDIKLFEYDKSNKYNNTEQESKDLSEELKSMKNEKIKILTFGDIGFSHQGNKTLNYLNNKSKNNKDNNIVSSNKYDLLLFLGDIAYNLENYNGEIGNYFMKEFIPLSSNTFFLPTVGNHEKHNNFEEYRERFPLSHLNNINNTNNIIDNGIGYFPFSPDKLYNSYIIGNTFFLNINSLASNNTFFSEEYLSIMISYITLELSNLPNIVTNKIAFTHFTFYCSHNYKDYCTDRASGLKSIFEEKILSQFDLVLSGHLHMYERSNPVYKEKIDEKSLIKNDSKGSSNSKGIYDNPEYPVYIVCGSAGNSEFEILKDDFFNNEYSANKFTGINGYCEVEVGDDEIKGRFISVEDEKIMDEFVIKKDKQRNIKHNKDIEADSNEDKSNIKDKNTEDSISNSNSDKISELEYRDDNKLTNISNNVSTNSSISNIISVSTNNENTSKTESNKNNLQNEILDTQKTESDSEREDSEIDNKEKFILPTKERDTREFIKNISNFLVICLLLEVLYVLYRNASIYYQNSLKFGYMSINMNESE